jgi:ABC-2 type transport system permease protein
MSRWDQVRIVASWEFRRFVKWRQQFIGLLVMVGISGVVWAVSSAVSRSRSKPVTVAVIGASQFDFALPTVGQVVWDTARYRTEEQVRAAVGQDSVGGALIVRSASTAQVLVRKRSGWTEPLGVALSSARRSAAFASLPLSAEQRARLSDSVAVDVVRISGDGATLSRETRIFAMVILGVSLFLLLNGFGTLFIGITGEKQQRITEQLVAMVSPQTWMDGKILGLSGAAAVSTGISVLGLFALARVIPAAVGLSGFTLPGVASEYGIVALVALLSALGVLMWFSFMAAIAATIDDPNSSTKSLLLFIPLLPLVLAFTLLPRADSLIARVFSVVPLTSMAVLPMRLLTTHVPWWEVALGLVLLAGMALAFRRMAGKVFALGMLMYGKEPSVRELVRWARQV